MTGSRRYPSDLAVPGMLHGRVLRPPVPGATLRRVDTVGRSRGAGRDRRPRRRVRRRRGAQPVPGRARARPGRRPSGTARRCRPTTGSRPGSASTPSRRRRAGAGRSTGRPATSRPRSRSLRPTSPRPTRRPTSPTSRSRRVLALASWGEDGRLTVWTGTQVPFGVRAELAEQLGLPEERVRVITPDTGGGFGGKHAAGIAVEAARLARAVGRPGEGALDAPRGVHRGPPAAGRRHRRQDAGPTRRRSRPGRCATRTRVCSGSSGRTASRPSASTTSRPTLPLRQGSYRALAATANHFARESAMDELAAAMGVDPLALRLQHLADERLRGRPPCRRRTGSAGGEPRGAGRGLGIACGVEKDARVATAVDVRVGADRRLVIERVVTALDCGAIVDPDGLANQVEGALVMGLGGGVVRGDPVRGGRHRQRVVHRLPGAADRRRAAHRGHPPGPPGDACRRVRARHRSSRSLRRSPTRSSRRPASASARCRWSPTASCRADPAGTHSRSDSRAACSVRVPGRLQPGSRVGANQRRACSLSGSTTP